MTITLTPEEVNAIMELIIYCIQEKDPARQPGEQQRQTICRLGKRLGKLAETEQEAKEGYHAV